MIVRQSRIWIGVASATVAATAMLAAPPPFDITHSTIDGGGVMFSSGGGFELSGTIGQPDAGVMEDSGSTFTLTGGFWFETPRSDCNDTGSVDLLDYDGFEACLTGPSASVPQGCKCFDVDRSGTVDLQDFAAAQSAFTG